MSAHVTITPAAAAVASGKAAGIAFLRRPGRGEAVPLVLLHGIGSNARSFEPLMAALPMSLDAIAWNAPGYAGSAQLIPLAPTPRDYAGALAAFLEALGLARIVLAGHSLGALFAGTFAAHYPEKVAALAMVSPALGYGVAAGDTLPAGVQARIDEIETLGAAEFAARRAPRLLHQAERKPEVLAVVRDTMAGVDPSGYARAVRALGAGDLLADAARIEAPTIVAVGAADAVTPPSNARKLYGTLRHASGYYEVADCGHALPQEAPEYLARLMAALMEQHVHV